MPIYYQVNSRDINTSINLDNFNEVGIFRLTVMPTGTLPNLSLELPILLINVQNYQEISFGIYAYKRNKTSNSWDNWKSKMDWNIPLGTILMNGNTQFLNQFTTADSIVDGFMLCLGGTVPVGPMQGQQVPNLSDKFVLSVSSMSDISNVGATGGSHFKTLSVGNLPPHSHSSGSLVTNGSSAIISGNTSSNGYHYHSVPAYAQPPFPQGESYLTHFYTWYGDLRYYYTLSSGNHNHSFTSTVNLGNLSISGNTGNTGSGEPIDIRPNYIKLAFIIKVL